MDYREWDAVADSAWLTFYAEVIYEGHRGDTFIGIEGVDGSKKKTLSLNIPNSKKWIYFEFYDLEMSVVGDMTHIKFIDTVHKEVLEIDTLAPSIWYEGTT